MLVFEDFDDFVGCLGGGGDWVLGCLGRCCLI